MNIQDSRQAKTKYGIVEGLHGQNPATTVFKGVPYASAPIGTLRFKDPVAPSSWDGVKCCYKYAPAPMQGQPAKGSFYQKEFYPVDRDISEDCLYLNIWTPAKTSDEKLPVMVWFHGGAFMGGSADEITFDGEAFAKRGVILVTVNYRLGIFSSFVSVENGVRGNFGSKDQLFSLKWVKENIAAFGGDPENVTIFGQSAGALSVQVLLSSEKSKGLISKAIIQSAGGAVSISGYRTLEKADEDCARFMKQSGVSFQEICEMDAITLYNTYAKYGNINSYPNIDGDFLKDSPGNFVRRGELPDIPYMTGTVVGDNFFKTIKKTDNYDDALAAAREYLSDETDAFVEQFLKDKSCFDDFSKSLQLTQCVGAAESFAKCKKGKAPVYLYHFNRTLPDGNGLKGYHSFELWYVFGTIQHSNRKLVGIDYELSNMMTDYWCSFAKTSNPNDANSENPLWENYLPENPKTLVINENKVYNHDFSKDKVLDFLTDFEVKRLESI